MESCTMHVYRDDETTASNNHDNSTSFKFYTPEEEPVLHPGFKERAERALSSITQGTNGATTNCCSRAQHCTDCCLASFTFECCTASTLSTLPSSCHFPHFSTEMKAASRQGTKMLRSFLFPVMPKLLTDLWVLTELGVTLAQFIVSIVSLMIDSNRAFSITYLSLASVALLLALIDAFIYFTNFGSCSQMFHRCFLRLKYRSVVEDNQQLALSSYIRYVDMDYGQVDTTNYHDDERGCCHLADKSKLKSWISESFELVRTVLSEVLIYPLLMFDLLDVVVAGSYRLRNTVEIINFSLFVIGSVFLFLSVYLSRAFMVINMAIQLHRVPIDPSKSMTNLLHFVTQFCICVTFQIAVHITVVMAVAFKLYQENPTPCEDLQMSCTQISPTLVYVIIVGGILPVYGVMIFFILNYFQLCEMSVGFWANMVSLLHSESFSTLIFSTKGIEECRKKAKKLVERVQLHQVKSQLSTIQSTPSWVKIAFPLKFPFFVPVLFLYVILLFSFVGALAYTYEQDKGLQFTLFENSFSSAFFILMTVVLAANLHATILVLTAILAIAMLLLTTFLQAVLWVLTAVVYVPIGACLTALSLISSLKCK